MKLRKFLEKVGGIVTEDKVLAKRISKSLLLMYNEELANKDSVFAMVDQDFLSPKDRIAFAFAFKGLDKVDSKKAERCESLVYLLSLYSYKEKYNIADYNAEILSVTKEIESEPIAEVDSLMTTAETAEGLWS